MSDWRIALSALTYGREEEEAVLRVLRSGWISMGPEVAAFEQDIAKLQKARHAFAVANGTGALHLALAALELSPGDEVIQPAQNFVAAANMTVAIGAKPVFADIVGVEEPIIDPTHVGALITSRTKAVLVMHYGGYVCRMNELKRLCTKRNLYLLEDACHALGVADRSGMMAGSIGDIGVFSFFSNKNVATGEGGMVVTDNDAIAQRVRLMRSHGMTTLTWDRQKGHARTYDVKANGFNYRLDDLHAALGRTQLKKLAAGNCRRAEIGLHYRRRLAQSPDWTIPFGSDIPSANHLMAVLAPDSAARERALVALTEARIQSSFHYPSISGFSAFSEHSNAAVAKSESFAARVITLPMHPLLSDDNVDEVCDVLIQTARHF